MAKTMKTTSALNLRDGAGTNEKVLVTIPQGASVKWTGYGFPVDDVLWYLVDYGGKRGFCSSKYLKWVIIQVIDT